MCAWHASPAFSLTALQVVGHHRVEVDDGGVDDGVGESVVGHSDAPLDGDDAKDVAGPLVGWGGRGPGAEDAQADRGESGADGRRQQ